MEILSSTLFQNQLKELFTPYLKSDLKGIKDFKLYLDTVILNIPSKVNKYKRSIYFDDDNIRDLEHQGYTIPFYLDEATQTYVILGIIEQAQHPDN